MQLTSHLNVLHSQQNTMMCFLNDQIEHLVLKKRRCSTEIKSQPQKGYKSTMIHFNDISYSNRHSDNWPMLYSHLPVKLQWMDLKKVDLYDLHY